MKFSRVSSLALGASAVSALSVPRAVAKRDDDTLTLDHFGWFDTISLDDAKSGLVKSHNGTIHKIIEDLGDDIKDIAASIADAVRLGNSGDKGSSSISSVDDSSEADVVSAASASCSNPNMRFEWRNYSDSDRHAFSAAFKCLMKSPSAGGYSGSTNRYEDLVRVHQKMVSGIHGNGLFLFWHRYFLWSLEQIMRDECGFDRAFPWWDETLDAGNFAGSSIFSADFFGTLHTSSNGQGICVTDGYFANTVSHIGPGTGFTNHCLSRAVDESLTAQCNADFVETCNSRTTYSDMENCAELGPHAYGHNGVGSVMADVAASPSDPAFFLHHLFIDRNFWVWQNADASRKTQITGCADTNSPCTPLTLDTVISVDGLRPNVTVGDIIDTEGGAICYTYV